MVLIDDVNDRHGYARYSSKTDKDGDAINIIPDRPVEEVVHLVTVTFYELPRKRLNEVFDWATDMGHPFSISVQDSAVDEN